MSNPSQTKFGSLKSTKRNYPRNSKHQMEVTSSPQITPLLRIKIDGTNEIKYIPLHFIGNNGEIFWNSLGKPFWINTPLYDVEDTVYEAVIKRKI